MKSGIIICLFALFLVACSGTTASVATNPTVEPTDVPAADTAAQSVDEPIDIASVDLPEWAYLELVDVNTRETFKLADYAGKTVYVHMMATWCTNCLASQRSLAANVVPQFGDDVVFVSLDVQTQISADSLQQYTERNEFGWQFAVTTNDFMTAITNEFGRTAANPPSTPHFIIYPDGTVTELLTGVEPPEEKIALIQGA